MQRGLSDGTADVPPEGPATKHPTPVIRCLPAQPRTGERYGFRGARGPSGWPTEAGAGLGVAGCWNFILRIGGVPEEASSDRLDTADPRAPLYVPLDATPDSADRERIRKRILSGGAVIGSGDPDVWMSVVPEIVAGPARNTNPYGALAWKIGERVELIAPPRWPIARFRTHSDGLTSAGAVAIVSGERQTPARALLTVERDAPATVRWRGLVFLNGSPFHALQAWLQGQEPLMPWLNWRHRLFWLDEWASAVRQAVVDSGAPPHCGAVSRVAGLGDTTIVLRHDLDHSRDTGYLEAEAAAGLPGVHAVLRDRNARFWVETLSRQPMHEVAFHYNTGRVPLVPSRVRRAFGIEPGVLRPDRKAMAGLGLWRQVAWARRAGIGVATIHRHLAFLIYPEWIDAVAELERRAPEVLGGSSLFRATVLRWGVDRADGMRGAYAEHPDIQFPWWFPARVAHAGEEGRLLRWWETASVMEPEARLVEQLLTHRVPGLPQRVFTLNYHPAHARKDTFAAAGGLEEFKRVLEMLRAHDTPVLRLDDVYRRMNAHVGTTGPETGN